MVTVNLENGTVAEWHPGAHVIAIVRVEDSQVNDVIVFERDVETTTEIQMMDALKRWQERQAREVRA